MYSNLLTSYLNIRTSLICWKLAHIFRQSLGLQSQKQFAKDLGISRSKLCHILSGKAGRVGGSRLTEIMHLIHLVGADLAAIEPTRQESSRCGIVAVACHHLERCVNASDCGVIEAALLLECHQGSELRVVKVDYPLNASHQAVIEKIAKELRQRHLSNAVYIAISRYVFSGNLPELTGSTTSGASWLHFQQIIANSPLTIDRSQ